MAPSALDLLVLTFNCAKSLINTAVFSNHLEKAFGQNATDLPDLVVLSLQEVAPLSYAFIGDYLLQPYIDRFDLAINQAAAQYVERNGNADEAADVCHQIRQQKTYSLMRSKNVGYTAILFFAKDSTRVHDIEEAEVGFGAAGMGNKGAVGLRVVYDVDGKTTELTFVATHLAAMEWNVSRRNANWGTILRSMTFGNPRSIVQDKCSTVVQGDSPAGDGEQDRLLPDEDDNCRTERVREQLHNISIFKPSSFLFVGGDLNYRISSKSPQPDATFPSLDRSSEDYYPKFFTLDQLTREKAAGRTLHGLTEAPVHFPPTYKYDVQSGGVSDSDEMDPVQWQFAPHRYPSWTDRILYLDLPEWVKRKDKTARIRVRSYEAMPLLRTSDHRPVFLRVEVPMLAPLDLAPPSSLKVAAYQSPDIIDPRLRLPAEIDLDAWRLRSAARRREQVVGWSMFLWSTTEGACILGTFVLATLGAYWLYHAA